ncbi:glycoside hydrolase family 19 protein [Magnetospirillum aberrantis]|uniref:Glycoside hydrolase family 19 protein n=1 Tax=Magnetospirillum aberrantis SpK TaxID=908842 RepID=A0A7C9QT91_9PROT|nr:glycoside hydrolase family 19 protein [Magnetospirillum aberrantis]NFV79984.1 glycoside hydrolase family 19 protein [Magnetospirillum aberrantis SpK]
MTIITTALLRAAMPFARTCDITAYAAPLDATARRHSITTPLRLQHWLAQIAHESGSLRYVRENMNYSAAGLLSTFPRHFTPQLADEYSRQPQRIASHVYAGREGNGDELSGDGWRYRAGGLIGITFRNNYAACGVALGLDLIEHPELLERPEHAAASVGWFWACHGLNTLADADNLDAIADIINRGRKTAAYGDANGFADRRACLDRARLALASGPTIA